MEILLTGEWRDGEFSAVDLWKRTCVLLLFTLWPEGLLFVNCDITDRTGNPYFCKRSFQFRIGTRVKRIWIYFFRWSSSAYEDPCLYLIHITHSGGYLVGGDFVHFLKVATSFCQRGALVAREPGNLAQIFNCQ